MRRLWQQLKGNSGSVLIFVALSIFGLAGMTILAVDISKLLVTRAQLQNAADAGALAGAQRFMEDPVPEQAAIEARAEDVAKLNKAFNEERSGPEQVDQVQEASARAVMDQADPFYHTVFCTTRAVVSQYFTGVVNQSPTGNVAALAAARVGSVCQVQCMKPWSIPDRWDDSGRPGWPQWANNGTWDSEKFVDLNGDGLWEPGELFLDGVDKYGKKPGGLDGQYTSEFYHPIQTGYLASKDLGLELTLKAGNPHNAPAPGQYYAIDLPGSIGAADYRWNIANCNPADLGPGSIVSTENGNMVGPTVQGMRDLIAQDPSAYWEPSCNCIKSQYGNKSPRIGFIPLHDPRIPLNPGKMDIHIVKIAAFFLESVRGNGDVVGRFIKVQAPGEQCPPGKTAGGFVFNLSLVDPKTPPVVATP